MVIVQLNYIKSANNKVRHEGLIMLRAISPCARRYMSNNLLPLDYMKDQITLIVLTLEKLGAELN